jgi:prepilin-type processing-associated H-X9-DG protein
MNREPPAKDGRSRISLIEIVFGAALLCLVLTLAFPFFSRAQANERQATCISNLHQLGSAISLYAADYDQTLFCPYYFGYCEKGRDNRFTGNSTLEPYIKNHPVNNPNSVWVCSEITRFSNVDPSSKNGFGAYYCTYTMNVFLNPIRKSLTGEMIDPDACYSSPEVQMSHKLSWNGGHVPEEEMALGGDAQTVGRGKLRVPSMRGLRLNQITSPSKTDLLFEGVVEGYLGGTIDTGYVGRAARQGDYTVDQGFWANQSDARQFFGGARRITVQPADKPRHGDNNNYLFCDGHVKSMPPQHPPYDVRNDPNNIWLARAGR